MRKQFLVTEQLQEIAAQTIDAMKIEAPEVHEHNEDPRVVTALDHETGQIEHHHVIKILDFGVCSEIGLVAECRVVGPGEDSEDQRNIWLDMIALSQAPPVYAELRAAIDEKLRDTNVRNTFTRTATGARTKFVTPEDRLRDQKIADARREWYRKRKQEFLAKKAREEQEKMEEEYGIPTLDRPIPTGGKLGHDGNHDPDIVGYEREDDSEDDKGPEEEILDENATQWQAAENPMDALTDLFNEKKCAIVKLHTWENTLRLIALKIHGRKFMARKVEFEALQMLKAQGIISNEHFTDLQNFKSNEFPQMLEAVATVNLVQIKVISLDKHRKPLVTLYGKPRSETITLARMGIAIALLKNSATATMITKGIAETESDGTILLYKFQQSAHQSASTYKHRKAKENKNYAEKIECKEMSGAEKMFVKFKQQ